jgi:hypothetical protein
LANIKLSLMIVKNIFKILIAAILLNGSFAFAQKETTINILGKDVRIRAQEGSQSEVIFKANSFETAKIISKGAKEKIGEFNDYWYKILIKGKQGWVYGAFTSLAQPVNGVLKTVKAKLLDASFGEDGGGYSMKLVNGETMFFAKCIPCDFTRVQNKETHFETIDPKFIGKNYIITYRTERQWNEPGAAWIIINVIQTILLDSK